MFIYIYSKTVKSLMHIHILENYIAMKRNGQDTCVKEVNLKKTINSKIPLVCIMLHTNEIKSENITYFQV